MTQEDGFVDYYELLQIPSTAEVNTILYAYQVRSQQISNDPRIPPQTKAQLAAQLRTALHVFSSAQTRFQFDVIRLMRRGELNIHPQPGQQDFPSRMVAIERAQNCYDKLTVTLDCLGEVHETAQAEERELRHDRNWDLAMKLNEVIDQIAIFTAHVVLQKRTCAHVYFFLIDHTNDNDWNFGIRDPRVDAAGRENGHRRCMQALKDCEDRIHAKFWPQFAQALREKDTDEIHSYPDRLMNIFRHLLYE